MFGIKNPFKRKGKNKKRHKMPKDDLTTWELSGIGQLALASINSEDERIFTKEKKR